MAAGGGFLGGFFTNPGQFGQWIFAGVSATFSVLSYVRGMKEGAQGAFWRWTALVLLAVAIGTIWLELHDRYGWVAIPAALLLAAAAYFVGCSGRTLPVEAPTAETLKLTVVEVALEQTTLEHVNYKRKLRIVLHNDGDRDVILGPGTSWRPARVHTRHINQQVWEAEPAEGWRANVWKHNESADLRVKPGRAARTWIGLHAEATLAEIEALKGELGALVVPVRGIGDPVEVKLNV